MTMIDVAKRAGVSQATVSRAINGSGYVSSEALESIKQAMLELDYHPPARRRTRPKDLAESPEEAGFIAILMLDNSMETHPSLALAKLRGVEAAAAQADLTVVVSRVGADQSLPPCLKLDNLVGALLWGRGADTRLKRGLRHIPTMWLSSHADAEDQIVLVGNEQAGALAARYLLARGVKRPAFLSPLSLRIQEQRRCNGFQYALHLANLEARVVSGDCREERQFEQLSRAEQIRVIDGLVQDLVSAAPSSDGVFIPDDHVTALVYPALYQQGIHPDKDLAIISCGNEAVYLNGLRPRPATIDLAPETTGRLAVEQLLRISKNPEACDRASVLVTPELVPGDVQFCSSQVPADFRPL